MLKNIYKYIFFFGEIKTTSTDFSFHHPSLGRIHGRVVENRNEDTKKKTNSGFRKVLPGKFKYLLSYPFPILEYYDACKIRL